MGTAMLRAGFSGDHEPLYRGSLFGQFKPTQPLNRLIGTQQALDTNIDDDTLDAIILEQLRNLYRNHLLIDSKTRSVAVSEGPMLPVQIKRSLCRVLLGNLRVPQVTFYPSAVVSLMTCGVTAGLVVDCGHRGTTVTPVYEGRPLMAYAVPTALGGDALSRHVRGLLKQHAKFLPFNEHPVEVTDEIISEDLCAFIVRKLVNVSSTLSLDEADQDCVQICRDKGLALGHTSEQSTEAYAATHESLSLPKETRLTIDTKYGRGDLVIPAWVCAYAADILLYGDASNDHEGILSAISRCIGMAPVDIRRQLISHLLVVGGVSDIPYFGVALAREVQFYFERSKRWQALASWVALANEPAALDSRQQDSGPPQRNSANGSVFSLSDRCWIGASLAVAARIGGLDIKRDDFDGYNLSDWTQITEISRDIERLSDSLEESRNHKRHKIAYDEIAAEANKLPSRKQIEEEILQINNDIEQLEQEQVSHEAVTQSLNTQYAVVVEELNKLASMSKSALSMQDLDIYLDSDVHPDKPDANARSTIMSPSAINPHGFDTPIDADMLDIQNPKDSDEEGEAEDGEDGFVETESIVGSEEGEEGECEDEEGELLG
ncbi:hypothetical protein LPJ78_004530 [Coemansia sp. RSA 989]|nr:hypothetical protein LPJ79_004384 [Coemansia sp. RSA 1821]KAJ1862726.1 hypothetical protein LPJ78_004530 [Coemansia sp. RSA 989]